MARSTALHGVGVSFEFVLLNGWNVSKRLFERSVNTPTPDPAPWQGAGEIFISGVLGPHGGPKTPHLKGFPSPARRARGQGVRVDLLKQLSKLSSHHRIVVGCVDSRLGGADTLLDAYEVVTHEFLPPRVRCRGLRSRSRSLRGFPLR